MKHIILIVGARPNYMKAFPVYEALKKDFKLTLIHTGQHYDKNMNELFFNQLHFPKPDIQLSLSNKTNNDIFNDFLYVNSRSFFTDISKNVKKLLNLKYNDCQICEIRDKLIDIFKDIKPDLVLLFGDIKSTLSGALASTICNIDIAHIESGLRSGDLEMPEEVNRIIVDRLSKYYFVTEESAIYNLKAENISDNVFFVGNTMIDTQVKFIDKALKIEYEKKYGINKDEYILLTLHRPSNVDNINKLKNIFRELDELINKNGLKIIYPVHPRIKNSINSFKNEINKNIIFIEPLGYLEFTCLMANSAFIITDSGGIQEESSALNIPCFTLRDNTERPSTLIENGGTNKLIKSVLECSIYDNMYIYRNNYACSSNKIRDYLLMIFTI